MAKQPRKYIIVHCNEVLRGSSVRFICEPAERSVATDLWLLAGDCGMDGLIAVNENHPYSHAYLAGSLNVPEELFEMALGKLKKLPDDDYFKVFEDKRGILMVNFKEWQPKWPSEYARRKAWEEKKKGVSIDLKTQNDAYYAHRKKIQNDDPDKYIRGKYGHVVLRAEEDSRGKQRGLRGTVDELKGTVEEMKEMVGE